MIGGQTKDASPLIQKMSQGEARKLVLTKSLEIAKAYPDKLFSFATGVGKTYVGLDCVRQSTSDKKWLVLVPQIPLIENFRKECAKHGFQDLLDNKIIDVLCYNSIGKYEGQELNLLFDEAHHLSELRLDIAQTIKTDEIIYLSATMPFDVKDRVRNALGNFHEYHISLEQAIGMGILPDPEVNIIYLKMDTTTPQYEIIRGKKKLMGTAQDYYVDLESKFQYWQEEYSKGNAMWQYNKMMQAAMARKRFIAEQKIDAARLLLKNIPEQRYAVFTGSVEQAQLLGAEKSVHSKNTKKKNLQIIEDFNNLKIDHLFCCEMLREGITLEAVEAGIILQLAGNDKQNVQTFGRLYRSVAPKLYVFVMVDTQDVKYFNNVTARVVDKKYVKTYNLVQ